jgi:DNA-binding transcriptional LysR family regulator
MLGGIEALIGLERTGTVSEAAVRLRLTQSAVSKRIKALEVELGYPLVEADGRRLRLTTAAHAFLLRAKPLIAELEGLKRLPDSPARREFSIGIADSIASSWGPRLLRQASARNEAVTLKIHVHRSLLVLEHLKLGRYELGIVTGRPSAPELVWTRLADEPMALVGSPAKRSGGRDKRTVLTIEPASATWRELGEQALSHEKLKGSDWVFVESFSAAAQMAKEGFGRALVPLGTAVSAGYRASETTLLTPRLSRQVHFVARKSIHGLATIGELRAALVGAGSRLF